MNEIRPLPEKSRGDFSTLPQGEGGFGGDDPRALTEEHLPARGPGVTWLELFGRNETPAALAAVLCLEPRPSDRDPCERARYACAMDLGLTAASIVIADKIVDGAPQWRVAGTDDENATGALILPVELDLPYGVIGSTLSLAQLGTAGAVHAVSDVIAFPPAGGRALSLTGVCAAIGGFAHDDKDGAALAFATGRKWLDAHLTAADELAGDYPADEVKLLIQAPHLARTLIVQPKAIEWRIGMLDCPVPRGVKTIRVVDSMGLAELIHAEMRKPLRMPPKPAVIGPSPTRAASPSPKSLRDFDPPSRGG